MNTIGDIEKIIFYNSSVWFPYIQSLKEPKDDFERCKNQYKCIVYLNKLLHKNFILMNLCSIPLIFIELLLSFLYSLFICKKDKRKIDLLAINKNVKQTSLNAESLPDIIKNEYNNIIVVNLRKGFSFGYLDATAFVIFLKSLFKYPFSFFFNLKILVSLVNFGSLIHQYQPTTICSMYSEKDFVSSLITYYCEVKGISFINIMHGEIFLDPRHAFVRFSEFYVWNSHYINIFTKTRSNKNMFCVYEPSRFNNEKSSSCLHKYYLAYYLQGQNEAELEIIFSVLNRISLCNHKCKLRIHKIASDKEIVERLFKNSLIDIEDHNNVSISDSMAESDYIVSSYSTVISEAIEMGYNAVIDDVSNPKLYDSLSKCMYINLERTSLRLSHFLN